MILPSGTYSQEDGSATCEVCASGFAQGEPGQTSCTECAAGTYSNADRTDCPDCAAGKLEVSFQ